jgi:hypothetical protein
VIEKDGSIVRQLEELNSTLRRILAESGAGYVVEASSPRNLLRLMAESRVDNQ